MREDIRALVNETTSLSLPLAALGDDADLYEAGMSSFEVVTLVVALEKRFSIRFRPEMMQRDTFGSIAAIHAAVIKAGALE
jgi:acyl carrier protein